MPKRSRQGFGLGIFTRAITFQTILPAHLVQLVQADYKQWVLRWKRTNAECENATHVWTN